MAATESVTLTSGVVDFEVPIEAGYLGREETPDEVLGNYGLEFNGEIRYKSDAKERIEEILPNIEQGEIEITATPFAGDQERMDEVQSVYDTIAEEIKSEFQKIGGGDGLLGGGGIGSNITGGGGLLGGAMASQLPNFKERFSPPTGLQRTRTLGRPNMPSGANQSSSFSGNFYYDKIHIPVMREGDLFDRMPPVPFKITGDPQGLQSGLIEYLQSGIFTLEGDKLTAMLYLPANWFFDEVEIKQGEGPCDLISEFDKTVEELRNTVETAVKNVESAESRLDRIENRVTSEVSVTDIRSLTAQDVADAIRNRGETAKSNLQDVKSRLARVEIPPIDINNLKSRTEDLRSQVNELVEKCFPNVSDVLDRVKEKLRQLESRLPNVRSKFQSLRDALRNIEGVQADLPSRDDRPSLPRPDLPDREEVRERITTRPEFVPCSEKYPDIQQQVDLFEEQVVGIRSGISEGEIESLGENANSLKEQIEDEIPEGDPCRERLTNRTQSALDSIERSIRSPRIRVTAPAERVEEFQQEVNDLRSQFESIVSEVELPSVDGDRVTIQ